MAMTSLREATKRFNVTKPTLLKALKDGKISGHKGDDGIWKIDSAELMRVYQPRPSDPGKPAPGIRATLAGNTPPLAPDYLAPVNALPGEADPAIEDLRVKLAAAEARADAAERVAQAMEKLADERLDRIEDLRRLLPAPVAPSEPAAQPETRRGWWPWQRR